LISSKYVSVVAVALLDNIWCSSFHIGWSQADSFLFAGEGLSSACVWGHLLIHFRFPWCRVLTSECEAQLGIGLIVKRLWGFRISEEEGGRGREWTVQNVACFGAVTREQIYKLRTFW